MNEDTGAAARITLQLEMRAVPEMTRVISQGLGAFNRRHVADDYQPVNVYAVDKTGAVLGGLIGAMYWHALSIESLWLDVTLRGQGLGAQMVEMVEQIARMAGCTLMHVDTMSFQARGFYEKLGFVVFGTLLGYAGGFERYYMHKPLAPVTLAPPALIPNDNPTPSTPDA